MSLPRHLRAVGQSSVVCAVILLSSCGGGSGQQGTPTLPVLTPELPGADVRIVEGPSGWQVGVPVAVKQGTDVMVWLNASTLERGNRVSLSVYLDPPPGGGAGFLGYSVASPGWVKLRFSSFARISVPGKYAVRVVDQSKNTLVQADFVAEP
jgi:hypothetical protein